MIIYTYQIAQHRKARAKRLFLLDTTVKSGEAMLAPTWSMVMGHKEGTISDEEYTAAYMAMLQERYDLCPDYFEWLCAQERVALGCYCTAGKFCHRLLLVEFLKQITEVDYRGEIT